MKMLTNNDKITIPQAISLLITTIIGTGVLSLPGHVSRAADSDGWILVILGSLMVLAGGLIVGVLLKRYPQDTFVEYSQKIIGRLPAYILCILLIVYFTVFTSIIARKFSDVMNSFMLPRTPPEFFILTILILVAYLIRHGVEPTARFSEIIISIMLLPVIGMYLIGIQEADFTELLPFLNTPADKIAIGSTSTIFSLLGPEILLVLGPYIRKPEKVYRIVTVSMVTVAIFYVFIVVFVFAVLGVEDTKSLLWPSMTIVKTITTPGRIFERLDALALALWTIAAFTSLNGYFFSGALVLAHLTKSREFKAYITMLFPWIYYFSFFPRNVLETTNWANYAGIAGIILCFLIPAFILLIDMAKKRGSNVT
jgi:spore germination protein